MSPNHNISKDQEATNPTWHPLLAGTVPLDGYFIPVNKE
jgi:hypothetical protein